MARNRGRYKGRRRNEPRKYHPRESERTTMLNLNRIIVFRYGIREIMSYYKIDEAVASTIIASVIAKGSRISIDSAKTFVREQEKTSIYSRETSNEICNLLDKFSKHR